jgi:hypothetical protein
MRRIALLLLLCQAGVPVAAAPREARPDQAADCVPAPGPRPAPSSHEGGGGEAACQTCESPSCPVVRGCARPGPALVQAPIPVAGAGAARAVPQLPDPWLADPTLPAPFHPPRV